MVLVEEAFFAVALIIFIGYFGMLFFKKTKISEIIILMGIGLLIGPILGLLGDGDLGVFQNFLPFFASFALMIILFEGGMQLNFFKTLRSLPSAVTFTIIVFSLTLTLIAAAWYAFTGNLLQGLLLGSILGGTSSAIVIPLINQTSAREETKMLLGLESALTDALCVIVAVAIAGAITFISTGNGSTITLPGIGANILSAFSIAAVLGFLFGIIWLKLISFFENKNYDYLVTLAVLLFLYSIVEYFHANGAIAALIFGIVLGNSEDLTSMLRFAPKKLNNTIKSFQMEVSFLVRTFFFVYLGILFSPVYLQDTTVIAISAIIIAIIIATRIFTAVILSKIVKQFADQKIYLAFTNARGLAAASLVAFPVIIGLNLGNTLNQMTAIVFLVILASNVVTTIGIFAGERTKKAIPQKKSENLNGQ